jgi:hypothetical protein
MKVKRLSGNWTSVKVALPPSNGLYLIHAPSADPKKPLIHMAGFWDGKWMGLVPVWLKHISHWMPLPSAPRKGRR